MFLIAIDGACRRNGKPDCIAAGGLFAMRLEDDNIVGTSILSEYEIPSTNQRGELLALRCALKKAKGSGDDTCVIVTDSEYIYNTMTKGWISNWVNKGWITSLGEPVKNKDLWESIYLAHKQCEEAGCEVAFYHIKGHAISYGKVTASSLLSSDMTGLQLYTAVLDKYDSIGLKQETLEQIQGLSIKNHGFKLDNATVAKFVVANTVADAVATKCVETADALTN